MNELTPEQARQMTVDRAKYRADVVEKIERTLNSYGSVRSWGWAAKHNLLMSLLGSLNYVIDVSSASLDINAERRKRAEVARVLAEDLVSWQQERLVTSRSDRRDLDEAYALATPVVLVGLADDVEALIREAES